MIRHLTLQLLNDRNHTSFDQAVLKVLASIKWHIYILNMLIWSSGFFFIAWLL